jgi:4-hydroxy-4-methyl-2-oxoglutarate aldolase
MLLIGPTDMDTMAKRGPQAGGTVSLRALCQRYRALYLPAVCDALYELGLPELVLPTTLRPLFPDQAFVGIAHTVVGREINPPVAWDEGVGRMRSYLDVFEHLQPDSVLVSTTPEGFVGHFGELTGNAAQRRGCVGVILDGNLRDVTGLREIGFPVVYRDLCPRNGIGRWEMTAEQVPVRIGDVTIEPGDVIIAEFEGVLVVPAAQAETVLDRAEAIVAAESSVRTDIRAGASPSASFDRYGHI